MSNKNLAINKLIFGLLIISAIIGYVVSINKIYLFHVILILYLLACLLGYQKIYVKSFKNIAFFIILYAFSCISLLWSVELSNGIIYLIYLFVGFSLVFILNNYIHEYSDLIFTFKVLSAILLLNFVIGIIESTGIWRLPMSPYINAPLGFNKPSGFNYNLNNFGFIFILFLPFMFFYPNKIISSISILLAVWFAYKLQSKGFFLSLLIFSTLILISKIRNCKSYISVLIFIASLTSILLFILIFPFENTASFNSRIFTTFDQISIGLDLILSNSSILIDSTSERAFFYSSGLREFINGYGVGLGIAGVSSNLSAILGKPIAFHFFFLEILIDLGIIPFLFLITASFNVIIKLRQYSHFLQKTFLGYLCKASFYSLLLLPVISITPSSLIYNLDFWIMIGFITATYNFTKNYISHQKTI